MADREFKKALNALKSLARIISDFTIAPSEDKRSALVILRPKTHELLRIVAPTALDLKSVDRSQVLHDASGPAKRSGLAISRNPSKQKGLIRSENAGQRIDTSALIVIGASTGGTEALRQIIQGLPQNMPPILIVQHIPEGFSKAFADSLQQISQLRIKEAADQDAVLPGVILLAPGNRHMELVGKPGQYKVQISQGDKVHGHRPSVDVLFYSVVQHFKGPMLGLILTGMGADGAAGLLAMKEHGALTYGQDAASSAVYGMPKVAFQIGAVGKVLSLPRIADELVRALTIKEAQASPQAS